MSTRPKIGGELHEFCLQEFSAEYFPNNLDNRDDTSYLVTATG